MFPKQGGIEFDSSNKKTVNHLLYDIDNENWCGLGCDSDGSFAVRVGVSDIGKHVFKVKTNGSITFDNKSLVTNSDIDVLYYEITYTGNGINQAFDIPLPSGYQSLWSSNVVMVDKTWEFKLNHCCCNFGNNNIHIDFSSDVNQNYSIKFVLSSFNNIK